MSESKSESMNESESLSLSMSVRASASVSVGTIFIMNVAPLRVGLWHMYSKQQQSFVNLLRGCVGK